jgi:hypothetical protein
MKSILRRLIEAINAFFADSKVFRLPALGSSQRFALARRLKGVAPRLNVRPPARPY